MRILRRALASLLAIAALSGCSPSLATIVIVNNTIQTINAVYISPSDEETWGDDLLSGLIPTGSQEQFGGILPGTYDLRVGTTTGSWAQLFEVELNAYEVYTWTVTS